MYQALDKKALLLEKEKLEKSYQEWKAQNLTLDMARGKPCAEQLSLSDAMNDTLSDQPFILSDGQDARNYGDFYGAPEARALFGDLLEISPEQVLVSGSSSLLLMYLCISHAMTHGMGGEEPWMKQGNVKFLCPSPGYDRHFAITEHFGVEMIPIDMEQDGPNMDQVEAFCEKDSSIKGIWLVPKYQNPQGTVFSDEVIRRLASLRPAAKDFRLYWDNAYFIHDLYEEEKIMNIFDACTEVGNPDLVITFASFSKVTYASSGIAAMASSLKNMKELAGAFSYATVSPNKVNQLRHVRFLQDKENTMLHMKKHANILRPKFEKVLEIFDENLSDTGIATWTKPKGGYFISVDLFPQTAKRTYHLCKEAGLTLTQVGATFPYGKDPEDKNIRIAPSYPNIEELATAAELFTICARLAAIEKILEK